MNDKSFKENNVNRTAADIMEDSGEQREEGQTLLTTENGQVKSFRHSNGKTYYCEQKDDYDVDERIESILKGKTIEKQMGYYFVTTSVKLYKTGGGEITSERLYEIAVNLAEYDGVIKLLLKSDILVGAAIKGYFGGGNLLLDREVCTYYASDNEGSGTNNREDYAYLIFSDK